MRRSCRLVLALGLFVATAATAAGSFTTHALVGGRIVPAPGEEIAEGTLVMRDGVVVALGANVEIPPGARVHELDGATVYPGLIEVHAVVSPPESDEDAASTDDGLRSNPLLAADFDPTPHAADAARDEALRSAGFTTALLVPEAGLLRGQGVVLNLGEGGVGANLLRRQASQNVQFAQRSDGSYPGSLLGTIALLRQSLQDAAWYRDARAAYDRDPAQQRPAVDLSLEAFAGVLDGNQPLVFESESSVDTLRFAAVLDEFAETGGSEIGGWIVATGTEARRLDQVAALGWPLVLSVAYPDAPDVGDEDDMTVSLEDLRHWHDAPDAARQLLDAGVTVGFTSHGLDTAKDLHPHLATSIERGLDADAALAGLTTVPARLLGLESRLGTLAPGKVANLVIVDGDLFVESPKIREVWVDGHRFAIEESKPAEVEAAGTWRLKVDAGGQKMESTLVLTGEGETLDGTVELYGQTIQLDEATVSGKTLLVRFDGTGFGMPGAFVMNLEITGERARGSGTSPPGNFTVRAMRVATPEGEGR